MVDTGRFVPPPYPYDRLSEIAEMAAKHDGGVVDLSIGTPCDAPPRAVVEALSSSGLERGYPASVGSPAFRRRRGRMDVETVRSRRRSLERRCLCGNQGIRRVPWVVHALEATRPRHGVASGDRVPDLRDGRRARRTAGRLGCRSAQVVGSTCPQSAKPTQNGLFYSGSTAPRIPQAH